MKYHMTMMMICNKILFPLEGQSIGFIYGGVVYVKRIRFEELFNYFSSNIPDFLPSSYSEIAKTWD